MSDNKFKVSALTFRPQTFGEVVSQEFVTTTLKNAIKSRKIAHSYLLSGPRGVGKTTIARIFAKAINCKNSKNGEPCNKCTDCDEITRGVHPDIFELDAASNRGIDDVRSIQDAAKYFPIRASYKFFIVDEVHMLTIQAFNALLKILEEPPSYLIFILATTNPERIPPTISSRCQRFALHRLKIAEISEQLKFVAKEQKIKIDEESLFLIAKLGDGALRDSLGIFDMAVSYCGENIRYESLKEFLNLPDKDIYFNTSDFIVTSDFKGLIKYFNELEENGFDITSYLNGITDHYRNLLIVRTTENTDLLDEPDIIKQKFLESSKNYSVDQIQRILKVLLDSEYRFRFSPNQKVLMESLLVELCRLNKEVVDISELISGLESLKKKTLN
ncbi:MAG: DNA polymerase III subunit gamma/tau [Ignavibacteria bacterium]|nr:DNA polymerase III subunit gamma/tau [Ignavibacteria bacterium]